MRGQMELGRNPPFECEGVSRGHETDCTGSRPECEGLVLQYESAGGRTYEPPELPREARERHVAAEEPRLGQVDDERRVDRAVQALAEREDTDGDAEDQCGLRAGEPRATREDGQERPRPEQAHQGQAPHSAPPFDEFHDR